MTQQSKTRSILRKLGALTGTLAAVGTIGTVAVGLLFPGVLFGAVPSQAGPGQYVVLGTNNLGMHCMQQDFSEFMILPPYNTLHAQVIRRGAEPDIMDGDVVVEYTVPGNTRATDKTNFWKYSQALFGVSLPPDIGLTGLGMSGRMTVTPNRDWKAEGIPITPINDDGRENAYPLARIRVRVGSTEVAATQAVVPVSWEIGCNLCHNQPGMSTGQNILQAHDRLHATQLVDHQPVNCSSCHSDPALGAPGVPGVSPFSTAMHGAHASRMGQINIENECYACHPGGRTQCQRDLHLSRGMTCNSCHTSMAAVGSPTRTPWVTEPRCADCHTRPRFEFEQPGKLFRESVGHGGVTCMACHGSPHALGPAVTEVDNLQATVHQGVDGMIRECTVCHTSQPSESFFHSREH